MGNSGLAREEIVAGLIASTRHAPAHDVKLLPLVGGAFAAAVLAARPSGCFTCARPLGVGAFIGWASFDQSGAIVAHS